MAFDKILFLTDFSPKATRGIGEAISFAKALDATLVIAHFYFRPVPENSNYVDYKNHLLKAKERRIDEEFEAIKQLFPEIEEINTVFVKKLDFYFDGLKEVIDEYNIDLILMATKGAAGFDEFWGSKTYKTSQEVSVPVLAIPKTGSLKNIKHIGVATNYDEFTDLSRIDNIPKLAKQLNAKIDFIHVGLDEDLKLNTAETKISQKLHEVVKDIDHTFSYVEEEDVSSGLIEFCTQKSIQLVIVLPTRRNFIEEIFHSSVTKRLAHHLTIPLLILS